MAEKTLTARFKQKVDTSTNWAANNPILLVGEIGCESDTFKIKVGDGSTAWNSLSYVIADADLTEIENEISEVKSDVATNTSNISTNTSNISSLQSAVNTNTKNISTNTANIATNATAISTEASTRSSADETLQTNIDGKVPKSVTNNNYESIVDNGELAVGQVLVDVIDNTQSKEGTVTVDGSQIALQIYDFSSSGTYPASVVLNTSGVNIGGKTYVQSLYVSGDIVQEGDSYVTEAEHLKVEDSLIFTRNGASVGLTDDEYTGLVASNYDGENYGALIYDNAGVARVGDVTITEGTDAEGNSTQTVDASATQPLATRAEAEDLTDTGVVYWDAENQRFVTSDDLTVNNSAGRIVTDASTGYVGEVFNDYTNNVATGNYSHAEGYKATASGSYGSHAEGAIATASGTYSHAEGYSTTASGGSSHAEGNSTIAQESYSHAEGYKTTASGDCSHAEGNQTIASGSRSHAGGYFTTADQVYQTAIGKYNLTGQSGSLFAVGNGTSTSKLATAFEVFQDGTIRVNNTYIISVDDDGNLAIDNVDSTLTTMSISLNGGTITYDASTDTFTI